MSDLHLALLALAGVLLVLLYVYNRWQERRMLRRLDASLRGDVGDPLMQKTVARPAAAPAAAGPLGGAVAAPVEAASAAGAPAVAPAAVEVTDLPISALYGGRIEPRLGPIETPAVDASAAAVGDPAAPTTAPAAVPRWVEDPMLDWVLELRCAHAVDGVTVFDAATPLARMDTALPTFLVAWDARTQQWVEPDRFGFYSELLVATQLAHRKHRLDEIGASRFIATVQQVALGLDADFDVPDVQRVLQLASELDRLCARFDVQIGLTLNAPVGSWDAARLARAAQAAGLVADGAQRWLYLSAEGRPLFAASVAAFPADRVALELDVPLAPVSADPLRTLFKVADALAMDLGARVIDDNGRPVNAASLSGVAEQLDMLYVDMRSAGIEPGGARAQRLYA